MKRFLVAVSLLLTVHSVFAQSIEEVLSQVAQHNITLLSLCRDQEAQVHDLKAANTIGGPSVEYSPFYKRGYTGMAESELIVSEEIDFPTKYAARSKQAKLVQHVNEQQYNQLRRDILLEAKLLCLDIIRTNQTLQMLRQRLDGSKALRQMYQKRMEAGDANLLEVNKVDLDCMEVQTLLSESENERTQLLSQLQQLCGGQPVDIVSTEQPDIPMITDYESFVRQALLADADIHTAEAVLQSADHEVTTSRKEWLPNLSLGYRRNTELDEKVNGVLVGVSFPLLSNKHRIKAAQNRRERAELQVKQTREEAELTLRARYQQLVSLQQVLDHSDVTLMRETLTLLAKALQHGEITALQYYTEINSIYEKLQRHIDVHCQSTKLLAELHKHEL